MRATFRRCTNILSDALKLLDAPNYLSKINDKRHSDYMNWLLDKIRGLQMAEIPGPKLTLCKILMKINSNTGNYCHCRAELHFRVKA